MKIKSVYVVSDTTANIELTDGRFITVCIGERQFDGIMFDHGETANVVATSHSDWTKA